MQDSFPGLTALPSEGNTAPAEGRIERRDLRGLVPLLRIAGRNGTKADIAVYRIGTLSAAVKDYSGRPWLLRQTLGRWLTSREAAAYRALGAAPGLPRFLGRIDRFALATEWIDARPLATLAPDEVPAGTVDRLREVVGGLHARGLALGDLHHRDVLIGADGQVFIVDLAVSCIAGPGANPLRRWLFRRLCDQDAISLARLVARVEGRDPDAAVAAIGGAAARRYRTGRRIKRIFDRLRGRS